MSQQKQDIRTTGSYHKFRIQATTRDQKTAPWQFFLQGIAFDENAFNENGRPENRMIARTTKKKIGSHKPENKIEP